MKEVERGQLRVLAGDGRGELRGTLVLVLGPCPSESPSRNWREWWNVTVEGRLQRLSKDEIEDLPLVEGAV